MSEMIERGAEAMRAKRRELINLPLDRIWPDLMRAAIEAMREPTIEMACAIDQCVEKYYPPVIDGPVQCWRIGIDQALAEPGPLHSAGSADQVGVPRAEE